MTERPVLFVKNITREGPGLLENILDQKGIGHKTVDLNNGGKLPNPTKYKAVVVLGGPDSANDTGPKMTQELAWIRRVINEKIPYLGICLGMQTLVKAAGGEVIISEPGEIGFIGPDNKPFTVTLTEEGKRDPLLLGLPEKPQVFHLHGETVVRPDNVQLLATGDFVENQIVKVGENAYGIQSHFELTPGMLATWAEQDRDLAGFDRDELIQYSTQIQKEYAQTAWTLFTNFLEMANL